MIDLPDLPLTLPHHDTFFHIIFCLPLGDNFLAISFLSFAAVCGFGNPEPAHSLPRSRYRQSLLLVKVLIVIRPLSVLKLLVIPVSRVNRSLRDFTDLRDRLRLRGP